jgi:hypothetical protein
VGSRLEPSKISALGEKSCYSEETYVWPRMAETVPTRELAQFELFDQLLEIADNVEKVYVQVEPGA